MKLFRKFRQRRNVRRYIAICRRCGAAFNVEASAPEVGARSDEPARQSPGAGDHLEPRQRADQRRAQRQGRDHPAPARHGGRGGVPRARAA
ncbi:MAG TPA: hypothetical protein VHJ34_10320 [Actinomycetota bacterium]|nr:hypothetical protein [Actinomycetota bacterium]